MAYLSEPAAQSNQVPSELNLHPGADPGCFLCQGAACPADPARLVVHRTSHTVVVLNRFPYTNGHLLVAPIRHGVQLDELSPEEHLDVCTTITRMVGLLRQVLRPDGFNIGLNLGRAAGAGVPEHLHWHLVPRWNGDTNFMLTTASVKVIPQALDELWKKLTELLRSKG